MLCCAVVQENVGIWDGLNFKKKMQVFNLQYNDCTKSRSESWTCSYWSWALVLPSFSNLVGRSSQGLMQGPLKSMGRLQLSSLGLGSCPMWGNVYPTKTCFHWATMQHPSFYPGSGKSHSQLPLAMGLVAFSLFWIFQKVFFLFEDWTTNHLLQSQGSFVSQ